MARTSPSTTTDYLLLDLEMLTSLYDSIYDEMDLAPTAHARAAEIAKACRTFLKAYDAKIPNDLR